MDEKLEYDIKEDLVPTIEKLTGTKLCENIGTGGFSIVKMVYNNIENKYYALKVVSIFK
ncbi:MAG: hypothetical protein MJ252_20395 [archaeon]|nr:hypothetical protein [archaeon]